MPTTLAKRMTLIKPSATLAISAKAKALKASGKNVISLSLGEPDFDTPEHIKAAGIKAIQDNQTHYTAVDGTPELKQAVINKFNRENQLAYQANQIIASSGAKQSIYNALQAIINADDEVMIPTPYWVSYPDMVYLAGGKPVIIQTSNQQSLKITPKQLEDSITSKTKLLILNSPSNPSGMLYSQNELAELAKVLLKHPQVLILTDDIYEHIRWNEAPFVNIVNACPQLKDRTIVVNGASKAFAMTGWRIGYAAGAAEIIAAMRKVQSQSTSNPCSISQAAAIAALEGDQQPVRDMVKAFKERHDFVYSALNKIDGIECLPAQGTFYAFPNVQHITEKLDLPNDIAFTEYLLNKAEVAVVPGSAFGSPGHVRISYAASMDTLQEALKRITKACS